MPTSRMWAGISFAGGDRKFPKQHVVAVAREGRMLLGQQNEYAQQIANFSSVRRSGDKSNVTMILNKHQFCQTNKVIESEGFSEG